MSEHALALRMTNGVPLRLADYELVGHAYLELESQLRVMTLMARELNEGTAPREIPGRVLAALAPKPKEQGQ